jgi:cytochrome c peroxidase
MTIRKRALALGALACAASLAACSSAGDDELLGQTGSPLSGLAAKGKTAFDHALPGTNGRSCATCHVEDEHTALSPAHVAALLQQSPHDPLFNALDADDPTAATLTFDHLKAGLTRVTLTLADNLDVIDESGAVITNAGRTLDVWRGVPTVENTAYTAPYPYDDRAATLELQAEDALVAHSQIHPPASPEVVEQIAAFERTVFSSPQAAAVAEAIEHGQHPPNPQPHFPAGSDGARGQVLFNQICAQCHGDPTQVSIVNAAVHAEFFPVINADGSVTVGSVLPTGAGLPAAYAPGFAHHRDVDLGIAAITYLGQIGVAPNTQGVDFPRYRIRFYTDASRTTKLMDMPPPPPAFSASLIPQAFSVDPGRAIISGNPVDFESFDIPQLRGIANTAPYFHDNSAADLPTVLDFYSQLILPVFPVLNLPYAFPPERPGGLPESLSPQQKAELLAFLQKL